MRICGHGGGDGAWGGRLLGVAAIAWSLSASATAGAAELGLPGAGPSVQVHGFVSQGWMKSTGVNYLGATKRAQGTFELTEVGINFTTQPTERLRIGMQLFTRDLGPVGNYNV